MILVGDVLSINIQVVIYFCIAVYWEMLFGLNGISGCSTSFGHWGKC